MLVDLHLHTNFSDGALSPQELIDYVKKLNVGVIAVTDHDEIGANLPARNYGEKQGIEVIAGVELSIEYQLKGRGHLHIVGLFIDPLNQELCRTLDRLKKARVSRAREIIEKLSALGLPVSYNELEKIVGKGSAGRPHAAALLVRKGIVSSFHEAFKEYLSKGCPAYVAKRKLKIEPAVELIHQAGGLAILAHPISLGFSAYKRTGAEILKLKKLGIDGVEAYYCSHDRYFTNWLLEFAKKNDLAVSGGSDFHGATKPDIQPGVGRGNLHVPVKIIDELKKRVSKKSPQKNIVS